MKKMTFIYLFLMNKDDIYYGQERWPHLLWARKVGTFIMDEKGFSFFLVKYGQKRLQIIIIIIIFY